MSTRKGKDQSAEQTPPSKEHSPEQVKEVALMLYARRASPLSENTEVNEWQWNSLVWQANELLDKLNEACEEVARQRKAGKRSPGERFADAKKARNALADVPLNASGNVPYNAAVMFITREKYRKVDLAKKKFETVVRGNARELGYAEQKTDALLARLDKNGMPLNEVKWRRAGWHEKEYQHYRNAERAKKRKPWSKDRRVKRGVGQSKEIKPMTPKEKASMREVIEEGHKLELERAGQAKKQKKVKALLKAARTGEIE